MNTPSYKSFRHQAFTLIELLVVISIIAILATIAVPAGNIVMQKAKELQAKAAMKGLEVAIKGYQTEYNRYPSVGAGDENTPINTATPGLISILVAKEDAGTKKNPREIRFYEPPTAKGLAGYDTTSRALRDTFGKGIGYNIKMDFDGDGQITNPYSGGDPITTGVIVYCAGLNGVWNLESNIKSKINDDLKSWE